MPKYINVDRLKAEETAAFEYAQAKMPNKIDRDLNRAVHIKLHRLLDDAPAENVFRTSCPTIVESPQETLICDTITVIRSHGNEIKAERLFGDYMLSDIEVNEGENVLVISTEALGGDIYQYGNYGANWVQIGEVCGYA